MRRILTATILVLLFASVAFAGTTTTANPNLSTTLQINATVQTAISFTLQNAAGSNCIVAGGGPPDYQITFGNVDGLGLGTGASASCVGANITVTKTVGTGATYMVPYTYTVHFSGFTPGTAKVTAYSSNQSSVVAVYEGTTAAGATLLSQTVGTPTTIGTIATNTTSATRYIGLFVAESNAGTGNGAALPGGPTTETSAYTTTVTYVVTPQ